MENKIVNAIKLKKAAQSTANLGLSTPVVTMVAMELAASWKPLIKSKTKAMNITKRINPVPDAIFLILN